MITIASDLTNLSANWEVASPEGKLVLEIGQPENHGLEYRVTLNRETVVGWSKLGLIRSGWDKQNNQTQTDFSKELSLVEKTNNSISENYTLVSGKQLHNEVTGNELSLLFKNADGHLIRIDARAYAHGVAFRYAFPEEDIVFHTVEQELTEFNLGTKGKLWSQGYQEAGFWFPAYENYFENGVPVGSTLREGAGTGWSFPALCELENAWVLMHESGFDGNYHASRMKLDPENGVYRIMPPDQADALGHGSNQSSSLLPWTLPWRLLVVSENLGDIVSSNLVYDLAEP
jgi:alpha-glucosidase